MTLLAALITLTLTLTTHAESVPVDEPYKEPLWEVGLGGGGTYTPDYPGASQNHVWAIPFPWGIYRGDLLHSDRHGNTRARFFHRAGWEFNASASGGLPASSSQNQARSGMPNLEWMAEVGPRLTVDLISYSSGSLLRFGLPVRAAFSTNGQHLRDRGFTVAPELLYDDPNAFGTRFDGFVLVTWNWLDRRFSDYFYSVDASEVADGRPVYRARGGYLQTDVNFGLMAPIHSRQVRLYAFTTLATLSGSANDHSPLFRSSFNASVSAVLIWTFAESKRQVIPED
jgi:outer membrane scaffolding protein for murein synthesis (MipA/OmpV family)